MERILDFGGKTADTRTVWECLLFLIYQQAKYIQLLFKSYSFSVSIVEKFSDYQQITEQQNMKEGKNEVILVLSIQTVLSNIDKLNSFQLQNIQFTCACWPFILDWTNALYFPIGKFTFAAIFARIPIFTVFG